MELLTLFLTSIPTPASKKSKKGIDWCNVGGAVMGTIIFTVLVINM